jgi:putative transposase
MGPLPRVRPARHLTHTPAHLPALPAGRAVRHAWRCPTGPVLAVRGRLSPPAPGRPLHPDSTGPHQPATAHHLPGATTAGPWWSGFDLINAFNAWKRSEDAGRVFDVAVNGTITKRVTGPAWRHEVSAQVFEEAAINLGRALAAYRHAKSGRQTGPRIGFPKRKRKGRCRDSFRLRNKMDRNGHYSIRLGDRHPRSVTLPTLGTIRLHDDTRRLRRLLRPVQQFDPCSGEQFIAPRAKILFAAIVRRGDRWYVSLSVHAPDFHQQRRHQLSSDQSLPSFVGVDRGLISYAVVATADGTEVSRWPVPKPLFRRLQRVRGYSRAHSRKRRGSSNRAKAARRLSREHSRITNLRGTFLHEASSQLAKTHSRLAIEDLQVANILANRRLARAVGDAGWAEFARQLAYKARWFDGELVVCDRWFSSTKTCHACGTVKQQMGLGERTFCCDSCGLICDRDRNAAANLAAWAERARAFRTAKQAAGSPKPLEGKALAIALPMVEPVPAKGGTHAQAAV